ncbi:MAG: DUF3368 domain-containing protein [Saprospiraceae bacterium]
MIIVSDTSPIANLILINRLDLIRAVFEEVIIPPAVEKEIIALENIGYDLSDYKNATWISVKIPSDIQAVADLHQDLDLGESEAIVLAKEVNADLLLIDERLGTNQARKIGLETVGLLGVLIKAKEAEIIPEVMPIVEELEKVGFWISRKVKNMVKQQVKE